jgi:hypothetical protein
MVVCAPCAALRWSAASSDLQMVAQHALAHSIWTGRRRVLRGSQRVIESGDFSAMVLEGCAASMVQTPSWSWSANGQAMRAW